MTALDHAAAGFGGACVGLVVGANWARLTAWLVTRHARNVRAYNATHHGAVTTRTYAPGGYIAGPPVVATIKATECVWDRSGRCIRDYHLYCPQSPQDAATRTTPPQPRGAANGTSGHTDTTGTTEGAETT